MVKFSYQALCLSILYFNKQHIAIRPPMNNFYTIEYVTSACVAELQCVRFPQREAREMHCATVRGRPTFVTFTKYPDASVFPFIARPFPSLNRSDMI